MLGSKSYTGLSVGGARDTWRGGYVTHDGQRVFRYTDIGLLEISITAMQSIPGAIVTGLTMRPAGGWATPAQKAEAVRRAYGWTPASEHGGRATMAERLTALRRSYRRAA